jgi:hypothetical protein
MIFKIPEKKISSSCVGVDAKMNSGSMTRMGVLAGSFGAIIPHLDGVQNERPRHPDVP